MLWDAFVPHVSVEVKGAPTILIESHLRLAATELCRRGHPWVGEIAPTTVNLGTATYSLPAAVEDALVFEVYSLWLDGRLLSHMPLSQMRRFGGNWPSLSGDVEGYVQLDDGSVTLFKKPAMVGLLTGLAALVPSPASKGLPDWLGVKFFDGIVAGAKARLFAMQASPWGNAESAAYYGSIFDGTSISVATRRASHKARGADASPNIGEPT